MRLSPPSCSWAQAATKRRGWEGGGDWEGLIAPVFSGARLELHGGSFKALVLSCRRSAPRGAVWQSERSGSGGDEQETVAPQEEKRSLTFGIRCPL
ncbi:hypothetical protein MHYP_G00026300 [Metynnis hypsauchen]